MTGTNKLKGLESNKLFSQQILLVLTEGKALYHTLHRVLIHVTNILWKKKLLPKNSFFILAFNVPIIEEAQPGRRSLLICDRHFL